MNWEKSSEHGVYLLEGSKFPKGYKEVDQKQYFHLCFIEDRKSNTVWLKCGITCNPKERMKAHYHMYGIVCLLWVSPIFSKYTAGKVEDEFKDFTRNHLAWEYIRNDRFIMPDGITTIEVRVRKTYTIHLG